MSNTTTFEFAHQIKILKGFAELKIHESSHVLSEKSLYGAGSTQFQYKATITYTDNVNDSVILMERSSPCKQNILKLDSKVSLEEQAQELINETLSNALFYTDTEQI